MHEKRKLEFFKYNKNFKAKIDINLLNYKLYSNKYIIYEENGKGKEYNFLNNELEYEGEYVQGKKQGKGKEYIYEFDSYKEAQTHIRRNKRKEYSLILKFEGEYLNGKRNGKGSQFNYNDKLIFEGE